MQEIKRLAEGQERVWQAVVSLDRRLNALGARWGLIFEEAFREGIVEKVLGTARVER